MGFLCQNHQNACYQLEDERLLEQWVEWMHGAGVHYKEGEWEQALTFAGSAYDLAKIRLGKSCRERGDAMAQVTLSAIYLSNILQHMGYLNEARETLILTEECLACFESTTECERAQEYRSCLRHANLRDVLIGRFLNLPYIEYGRSLRVVH